MIIKKWIKDAIRRSDMLRWMLLDRSHFLYFQQRGIHVVPNHFYQPIPDTSQLDDAFLARHDDWKGIALNETSMIQRLTRLIDRYKSEYESFPLYPTTDPAQYYWDNGGFQCLDAVMLYGMVREVKPKQVIEVGGGNSTKLTAAALRRNRAEGSPGTLTCIEPYPNPVLQAGFDGLTRLWVTEVQRVPLDTFTQLQSGDILFIDSSHVLKTGSDVHFYFESVLPHLPRGVYVHFHDIFLPEEYPKEWIMQDFKFYTEQYILRAFLTFNDHYEVLLAGRHLQLKATDLIERAFDFYPLPITKSGSIWLQRVKE